MEKHCLEVLRKRRRELNYSQEYLAEELGITQKAYSDIENGKTLLKIKFQSKLAAILGLIPDEICPIAASCSNIYKDKNEALLRLLSLYKIEIPNNLL